MEQHPQTKTGSPDTGEERGWGFIVLLEHQTLHPQFSCNCSLGRKTVSFAKYHLHVSFLSSLKLRPPSHHTQPMA